MRDSEVLLDGTKALIEIVGQELEILGLTPDAIKVIQTQIIDIWEIGGKHALAVLREVQLDNASMN